MPKAAAATDSQIVKALEAPLRKSVAAAEQSARSIKEMVPLMKKLVADLRNLEKRVAKLEKAKK